ncbi:diguanylate cyclase [Thalassotalea sp. G2M2-11]|uniref:sensor domain-containing diguanylate cyclase n=1 Tax=Thalassotalea sp. G2M2-11 TaxID=2787627 RepID=UPI0019D1943A|nr:diguanylate cyclase [Thalassotalea sp. G2M2-11]
MRSFRKVLTVLLWLFALIPVLLLSFSYIQNTKQQILNLANQQLNYQTNSQISTLKASLQRSFADIDEIASDGGIITSLTLDIISGKALDELELFLKNHSSFQNIMVLNRNLFQIEALPNEALAIDLTPFKSELNKLYNDKKTINEPNVRIIIIPAPNTNNTDKYLFAVARPILQPKESLIQPFEVNGMVFSTLPLKDFVENLMALINSQRRKNITIIHSDDIIYQYQAFELNNQSISYETTIDFGNNAIFSLVVSEDLSDELTISAVLTKEKQTLFIIVMILILILLSTNYIIHYFIKPLDKLKLLTRKITEHDWHSNQTLVIKEKSRFVEIYELKQLLSSMAKTIQNQFNKLKTQNAKLTDLTEQLTDSFEQSSEQSDILQNLLNYDQFIRTQEDVNNIGCLTLGLAYSILHQPIGLVIYRSHFQTGFKSLENANHEFVHLLNKQHFNNVHFDQADIEQINQSAETYQLTLIHREEECVGYIVSDSVKHNSFQAHALEVLVQSLQSRIQELHLKHKLSSIANTDALTGLYNRYYFDQVLTDYHHKYISEQYHFCLVLIDINGLKKVNDDIGHKAGDLLIQKVGQFLKSQVRSSDIIARLGGDEFAILLSEVDSNYCEPLCHKLMDQIKHEVLLYEETPIQLSFSCGAASSHQDPVENLFELADKRMYQEKKLITRAADHI